IVAEAVPTESGEAATISTAGGKRYGGIGHYLGGLIEKATGAETRVTVLGHVQRGGQPGDRDRLLASAFGVHAVDLIAEGKFDRVVSWWDREVVAVPLAEAISAPHTVDPNGLTVHTARGLGICFGDCPCSRPPPSGIFRSGSMRVPASPMPACGC